MKNKMWLILTTTVRLDGFVGCVCAQILLLPIFLQHHHAAMIFQHGLEHELHAN